MSERIRKDVGEVTAYAYAVAGGYEGSEADFTALLGSIAEDLGRIENLSVTVTTLPAGSSATASLNGSVLSLGIPKGDKGDKGNTGNTPDFGIGTVTTLSAGSSATASITGTAEAPVLNLGIPEGQAGSGAVGTVADAYSSSSTYAVGDYAIHDEELYVCTTAITTAEAFTAAHWTQVVLGDDVSDLKSDISVIDETANGKTKIYSDWVVGAIITDDTSPIGISVNTNIKYRIATNSAVTLYANTTFYIEAGYRLFIFIDDGTGKYVSEGAWRTGTYNLGNSSAISAYLMISKSPESSSDVANTSLYSSKVFVDNKMQRSITEIENTMATTSDVENISNGESKIYGDWGTGSIAVDNTKPSGIAISTGINYRVITLNPVTLLKNCVFTIKNGYKIVLYINDGTGKYIYDGAWRTGTYELNNDSDVSAYVMIALETETQEQADVRQFSSSVLVQSALQAQINECLQKVAIAQNISDGVWTVGTQKMRIEVGLNDSKNGTLSYGYIDYNGSHLKQAQDDICPINLEDVYYVGANHGYNFIYKATLTNHGLTASDIGKTCVINGDTWVLLQVNNEDTFTVCCYSSQNWWGMKTIETPPTTFNFGTEITVTSIDRGQLYPSVKDVDVQILDNNTKHFIVSESYDIISPKTGIDALIDNVGDNDNNSVATLSDALITVRNLYDFDERCSCVIQESITLHDTVDVNFYGATQSMPYGANDYFAVPMTSYDLLTEASGLSQTRFSRTSWDDSTKPPIIYLQANNTKDLSTSMMLQGIFTENRNAKINSEAGFIYTSRKMYPYAIEPESNMSEGDTYFTVIRIPMYKNNDNPNVKYCGFANLGTDCYVFCYNNTSVNAYIALPSEYLGKTVETVLSKNATCSTQKTVTGIDIAITGEGYVLLKLN